MSTETGMKNHAHEGGGHKRGPTSFQIHDPDRVFDALPLKKGDHFLDAGCGPGDYSIRASECVGDAGLVFALDKDKQMIEELRRKARKKGITNIRAVTSDFTASLPLRDHSVDVCLAATVLHIPAVFKHANAFGMPPDNWSMYNESLNAQRTEGDFLHGQEKETQRGANHPET